MALIQYFLSLEKRFSDLRDHIEIHPDNFGVYSNTIGQMLLTTCSEFEVVCKEIGPALGLKKPKKIMDIFETLGKLSDSVKSDVFSEKVYMFGFKIDVYPFVGWTKEIPPFWWKAYNEFKHDRLNSYKTANLKALIYSLSALSIVNHYYLWCNDYKGRSRDSPRIGMTHEPEVFRLLHVDYGEPPLASDFFDI